MGGIRDLSAQNSGPPAPVPEKREEKKQRGRAQQRGAQKDKPRKFLDAYCYDLTRAAREGKLDRVVAVSYTHLDVYKRQVLNRAAGSRFHRPAQADEIGLAAMAGGTVLPAGNTAILYNKE